VRLRGAARRRERLPAEGRHCAPTGRRRPRHRVRRGAARADRDAPAARTLRSDSARRRRAAAARARVPDRAWAGDPDASRERVGECGARREAVPERADDQDAPFEHLSQARRPRPRPGRDRGLRCGSRRARRADRTYERLAPARTNGREKVPTSARGAATGPRVASAASEFSAGGATMTMNGGRGRLNPIVATGRWSTRHPWQAIAVWLSFVALAVGALAVTGSKSLQSGTVGEAARGYA